MDGDEARRAIWLVDVPLAATHRLRSEINNGKYISQETLEKYEVPIVASALKLYLLELPDSLVSSNLYEIIKALYSNSQTAGPDSDANRISVLQSTLGQLRLVNIATLDAITTHFHRVIDLTSADEAYVQALAQSLAPCILRSKTETALSLEEKYNYRFLRDLLQYKDAIFNELKRAASLTNRQAHAPQADQRSRALSSADESKRRAHMEERARAIANRSRASSPATREGQRNSEQNRHRRDSSKGPSDTRFPVNVSARINPSAVAGPATPGHITRQSLEVPGSNDASPVAERTTNGHAPEVTDTQPSQASTFAEAQSEVEKRNSLGRATGARFRKPGGLPINRTVNRDSQPSSDMPTVAGEERRGVELVDKPYMDD